MTAGQLLVDQQAVEDRQRALHTPLVPAPGHSGVDFETRVDFNRLRDYRLATARAALEGRDFDALLVFDTNTIRYITGTVIGECRCATPLASESGARDGAACGKHGVCWLRCLRGRRSPWQ